MGLLSIGHEVPQMTGEKWLSRETSPPPVVQILQKENRVALAVLPVGETQMGRERETVSKNNMVATFLANVSQRVSGSHQSPQSDVTQLLSGGRSAS